VLEDKESARREINDRFYRLCYMLNVLVARRQLTISTRPEKVVTLNDMLSLLNPLYRIIPIPKPISTQIYAKQQTTHRHMVFETNGDFRARRAWLHN